jgi:hypothetical protein
MAEASRSVCAALLMMALACGGRASRKAQPYVDPAVAKLAADPAVKVAATAKTAILRTLDLFMAFSL